MARSGALERAGLALERAVPRLRDVQRDGVFEGAALFRGAAVRSGGRDDAAHSAGLLCPLEAEARGRRRAAVGRRRGVGAGPEMAVRREAARHTVVRLPPEARRAAPPGRWP